MVNLERFVVPESLADALRLLAGGREESRALAGGTSLIFFRGKGTASLVDITRLGLDGVKADGDDLGGDAENPSSQPARVSAQEVTPLWTTREKEIVTVGISVAAGCRPCTTYHLKAAREAGASSSDIETAVKLSRNVRDWAAASMERHGLAERGPSEPPTALPPESSRTDLLVALGAAFVVHGTVQLGAYFERVKAADLEEELLEELIALAAFIEGKARTHAERKLGLEPLTTESSKGSC